ncbi:Uncharacterized protein SCG7086_AJ_00020 [Chlamydiales bacterium SCGC AG-110-P3]|nr:Uncharacterized protein SCG7086_AJ_00020 [Chlamydiales bacterium SCGC AG-110-P3]
MFRHFPSHLDRRLVGLVLLGLVPLLFLPKINIVSFAGHTSGVRIDDILLASFGFFGLCVHYCLRIPLLGVEKWIMVWVLTGLLSIGFNQVVYEGDGKDVVMGVFYALRPLEYFLFFYLGLVAAQWMNIQKLIYGFVGVTAVIIVLQAAKLIGSFTVTGVHSVTGMASFDSEMGAMLNLLYCYVAFAPRHETVSCFKVLPKVWIAIPSSLRPLFNGIRNVAPVALVLLCQVLVNHRTSIAVFLFLSLVRGMMASGKVRYTSLGLIVLMIFLLFTVVGTESYLFRRSAKLFNLDNFQMITVAWENVDLDHMPQVQGDVHLPVDMSWWMRLHKWCYALKHFIHKPLAICFGIGPGFLGPALDGGVLRLLVEYGLAGSLCFFGAITCLWRTGRQMKWVVSALLLNMILFDAHLAYKLMSLFFFLGGAAHFQRNSEADPVEMATTRRK